MHQEHHNDAHALTITRVVGPLVANRRLLLAMAIAGVLVGVLHYSFSTRVYQAEIVILPDQGGSASLFGSAGELALMAGLSLPGATDPSLYFRDVLLHTTTLDRLLDMRSSDEQTFLEKMGYENEPEARDAAVRELRRSIDVSRDMRTGVVVVEGRAGSPTMAEALVDSLTASLDRFLRGRRQAEATDRLLFLQTEIAGAEARLAKAEARVVEFQSQNRMIEQSPALRKEFAALEREVLLREAVMVELRKQAEVQAITSEESLASFRTVGAARAAVRPVRPRPVQSIAMALILFIILGCCIVYFRDGILPALKRDLGQGRP